MGDLAEKRASIAYVFFFVFNESAITFSLSSRKLPRLCFEWSSGCCSSENSAGLPLLAIAHARKQPMFL
jgi:hypothetical protein